MEPVWNAGQPQNLEAAAFDALEWLLWLRRTNETLKLRGVILVAERDEGRLNGAISCLGEFLPDDTRVNQPPVDS